MSDHKHNSIDYVEFSGKNSDSIAQIKNLFRCFWMEIQRMGSQLYRHRFQRHCLRF